MKKIDRLQIRLDQKTRENLEQLADHYGLSQAAVVRLLVNSTGKKVTFSPEQPAPVARPENEKV